MNSANQKYQKSDPKTIQSLFDHIARRYERGNALLSFQLYKLWNRSLIKKVITTSSPVHYLDLCCGTGDISLNYLKYYCKGPPPQKSYLLDFSHEMLECAKEKQKKWNINSKIEYLQADAQAIPLANSTIDCCTIAYGIRNVKDPSLCFRESYRILKPGGVFGILELTRPKNPILRFLHHLYLKLALPVLGHYITSNREAYQYLCDTIHKFIPPEELSSQLRKAGFKNIVAKPFLGGIATIITSEKSRQCT